MDDGQEVKNGGVTLCTDSFTFEEVDLLKAALESKFNILTTILSQFFLFSPDPPIV